jgi:hypothetical protein
MGLSDIKDMNKNDFLGILGLTTKPTASVRMLGSLGMLGIGLLCGAGVALLLAPKSGQELREDLGQRLKELRAGSADDAESGESSNHASPSSPSREHANP